MMRSLFTTARSFGWSLVGGAVVLCAAASFASAAEPRVELHRKWVEEKDAEGFYPATSTKGHFSILSPIPFNDYTIIADDPNVGQLVLHGLGSKSTDGYEFGAIETEMNERTKSPDLIALVHDTAAKLGGTVPPLKVEKSGDEEFVFAAVAGPSRSAFMRVSKTPRSVFTIACEYPTDQREIAEDLCGGYLASFRLSR